MKLKFKNLKININYYSLINILLINIKNYKEKIFYY